MLSERGERGGTTFGPLASSGEIKYRSGATARRSWRYEIVGWSAEKVPESISFFGAVKLAILLNAE